MPHGKIIALCSFILIGALVAVGVLTNGIARHVVQTAPAWLAVIAGARGAAATKWIALPVFLVWLGIMLVIWLYLLGIAHIVTGAFSPLEIGLTIAVGVASVFGLGLALHARSGMSWGAGIATFAVVAALQVGAVWLGMQPHFANDTDFKAWIAHAPSAEPASPSSG